jgi:hypothetical protein
MNRKSYLRASARWLAAGVGVTAAAYGAYVGMTWYRYGDAAPPSPEEQDPLLDRFMPSYDVAERHHVRIAAPAAVMLAAAQEMELLHSPCVRVIIKGRELILGAKPDNQRRPRGLLAEVQSLGWGTIAEVPGRETVVGGVTKPWEANPTFRALPPDEFLGFSEHDYVKIVWTLRADPVGTAESIFRTEVSEPFFSPDGEWIGFFSIADHKLKKIRVAGGAAVAIGDIDTFYPRGASWGDDGFIVFNPDASAWTPLLRVPAAGGKPEPLSTLSEGEIAHRWPQVMPGAHALLYASFGTQGGIDASNIVAQRLPSGPSKIVIRGAHYARFLRSGHLVYAQGAALFAVPFDVNRLEVTGQPVAIVQGVTTYTVSGAPLFAVSDAGTLAYVPGDLITTDAPMMWMRRDGTMTRMRSVPRDWRSPQFSPDGKRIAFHVDDLRQLDVYTYEWARDFTTRLTSDPAVDPYPVWSPDGRTIVFASSRGVKQLANLYWASADGSGEAHRLTTSDDRQLATSWHPSGKYVAFDQQISPREWDLMVLPMDVSGSVWTAGTPTRVMSKIAQRPTAVFSPDGQWVAYTSNESGRSEVFVRSFPGPGAQWQVSTSGGWVPTWSRRRNELVYLSLLPDSHLMVVSYTIEGETFRAGPPRKWSEQPITDGPRRARSTCIRTAIESSRAET